MSFLVVENKKLAINPDLISTVRVTADDGAQIAIANDVITLPPGDDANAAFKSYGLQSNADDADAAKAKSGAQGTPTAQAHQQHDPHARK